MEYGNSKRPPINSSNGAIFMCNKLTKKECFQRKLFGLHSNYSDFVKVVKTGTILFLFEPEERKLNGVFRATSDSAMNIVPSAFSSSQKRFPVQVRFETLCACRPLSENEFREAIEENYFTPTKFTFALSRQQVCKLMFLFSSRSGFSYDRFPGGIQSEFMKTQQSSNLARTRAARNEKLLKFDTAGYMENNNIHSTSNPSSSVHRESHSMSYHNHDLLDMRLQNHMVRRQHKLHPTASRTLDSHQHEQMLSKSSYDLPISSVQGENHLKSYSSHELHDITVQNHIVRRQHEPYLGISHTLESGRPDQLLSKSCYDLPISSICSENHLASYPNLGLDDISLQNHVTRPLHESYPAVCHTFEPRQPNEIVSEHHYGLSTEPIPYSSSLRLLHEKPPPFLGTERPYLHKISHDLCTDSSLDFESSHIRTKSYTSKPHLGANYYTLTNYPGSDISKFSPISESSKPSPPSPEGHINFRDFNRSASPEGSHPPPGRLQAITSSSLRSRNTRAYSRPTQQEGASSSIHDYPSPSLVDYVPISERDILVDSSYKQVLKDEVEAFKLFPIRNKFHYQPGFTTDTDFPDSDDFDFIYNDKSGASDLMFSQSNVVQKRCSVFSRLSRSTKDFKYPRRNLSTKMNRKPENLETLENDAQQLDNIGVNGLFENDSIADILVEKSQESSGSAFRNFKRRSMVKQESIVTSDLGKCKKRKIVRPSFTEGNDSSQIKNSRQNHLFQPGEGPEAVGNLGPPISSLQHKKDTSTTDSSAIDIRGSQQTLHQQSELGEKFGVDLIAQESRNSYSIVIRDDNVEGKRENMHDLPLHSLALLEEKHKVIHESENSSTVVIHADNADGKKENSCHLPSHSSALPKGKNAVIHESENPYNVVIRDDNVDGKEENLCDLPSQSSALPKGKHAVIHESENSYSAVIRDDSVDRKEDNSCDLPSHSSALPKGKHAVIHESENSYRAVIHVDSVDRKEENSHDLPLHSPASLEEMNEATYESENSYGIVILNNVSGKSEENLHVVPSHSSALPEASTNSTAVFSTSNTCCLRRTPGKRFKHKCS